MNCHACSFLFLVLINICFEFLGPRPLDVFIKSMPYRLFMGVVFVLCVWWTNIVRRPGQEAFPIYFYATILLVYAVHQVINIIHALLISMKLYKSLLKKSI